jgi:hypothetical protein
MTMGNGWGQINDGAPFHVLTVDLDRAIAHLGLGRFEQMLLQYVREHSWGTQARTKGRGDAWPDPVPACVNLAELARAWDVPRQRLSQAKWTLINRNVLIEEGDRLTINKNASTWAGLTPASHLYCQQRSSIERTRKRAPGKPDSMDERTLERAGSERESVRAANAKACGRTNTERACVPEDSEDPEDQTPRPPERAAVIQDSDSEPFVPTPGPDTERRVAAQDAIFSAAVREFGDRGARWASTYGHEYHADPDGCIKAIEEARIAERGGATIRSVGGFIRSKYDAMKAGPGLRAYQPAEKPRHFRDDEYINFDNLGTTA